MRSEPKAQVALLTRAACHKIMRTIVNLEVPICHRDDTPDELATAHRCTLDVEIPLSNSVDGSRRRIDSQTFTQTRAMGSGLVKLLCDARPMARMM